MSRPALPATRQTGPQVLIIDDDAADVFLVQELLLEADSRIALTAAASLAGALPHLDSFDAVLLDLELPDAFGIDAVRAVLAAAPQAAIIVLSGRLDESVALAAIAEGAHDYLVKGQLDGVLLGRAIRYAIERKTADITRSQLLLAERNAAESARLERGLLALPLISADGPTIDTFYRPGRQLSLVGGDFFDVVQTSETTVQIIVGDVSGHGPDEAALGAGLRFSWRALTLAGVPQDRVLSVLEAMIDSERSHDEMYATAAVAQLDLAGRQISFWLAGHPPPLLTVGGLCQAVDVAPQPWLGLHPASRSPTVVGLPQGPCSLLLYTDGIIEGASGKPPARLGTAGLSRLWTAGGSDAQQASDRLAALVAQAESANGGSLTDDVAVVLVTLR